MRQAALSLVAVAVLVSCQGALAPAATAPPPTTTPTSTPTASPGPTPTLGAPPSLAASTVPPTEPTPTTQVADPCASSTSDDPATPPEALIEPIDGGEPIAGRLGSYTYCDVAADALPPRSESLTTVALEGPAQIVLSVADGGEGLVGYRAGYWTASEWQGDEVALGAHETAAPLTTTEFVGPPTGDWMLAVNLTFAGGGSALYYWHVTVP